MSAQKQKGTYRIAVIGDSFTYGQGISEDARFTNFLENHLNQSGEKYEVLNVWRPGAESIDHLTIFNNYVVRIFPDYVLLQ